jgi:hypothetical protein
MLRRLICASTALLILTAATRTEAPRPLAAQPEEAAVLAIHVLRKLVDTENFKMLGFETLEEVNQAKLGPPLAVFNIGLEQLKGYKSGQDVASLLTKTSESVYPVLVNDQVRSSVTIVRREGGYEPSSFGNADVVKRLMMALRKTESGTAAFIVRVPALNVYFLGSGAGGEIRLAPIIDDPRIELRAGEARPAGAILNQLVPLALAYNGLPT